MNKAKFETLAENSEAVILNIRQQIMAMGANDSEFYEIDKILNQLHEKKISDAEAIDQAMKIQEGKLDYH